VKAFLYQDHEAHIGVHTAMQSDPTIQAAIGQNPQAPVIMGAMQAHIAEHLAYAYRKQIEEQAGVPYPAPDQPMDEETEVQVSRLAAAAAQKVLAGNQAKAQQAQAAETAKDPVVQMAQEELAIKKRDQDLKDRKFAADTTAQADKLELEKERIATQERIAGLQVGAKIATSKAELDSAQEEAGLRMGIEVAKEASGRETNAETQGRDHAHKSSLQDKQAAAALLQQAAGVEAQEDQGDAAAEGQAKAEAEAPEPEEAPAPAMPPGAPPVA
jgi:hypothetical protein